MCTGNISLCAMKVHHFLSIIIHTFQRIVMQYGRYVYYAKIFVTILITFVCLAFCVSVCNMFNDCTPLIDYNKYISSVQGIVTLYIQQTQNICITFVHCWTNVEDVALYKCYTNVLCLLGIQVSTMYIMQKYLWYYC